MIKYQLVFLFCAQRGRSGMGNAKLKVWLRDKNCNVVKKVGHMHVLNCQGEAVVPWYWFTDGYTEVELPPGCYIVFAGLHPNGSNMNSDKAIVIIKCDETVCVNLILSDFVENREIRMKARAYTAFNCVRAIATPLYINAMKNGIHIDEVKTALEVLSKASKIEVDELMQTIKEEIDILQSNKKAMDPTEREFFADIETKLKQFK
jgi:hypothetical protein